jgi:multidrug resistance protein MdtO
MGPRADRELRGASLYRLIVDPSPGRFAFALRLALICTLVAVFAEIYTTPEIALTVYVAFFLNKPDRTSSMLLTVAITIVITVVIGVLLVLATPVLGSPGLRVLTMTLISLLMTFMASASKLKPLASTIALVLAYALDVLGSAPLGGLATRALLYAWLFVAIPALISAIVNLLIAPSPRSMVQKELAEQLRTAAAAVTGDDRRAVNKLRQSVSMGDAEMQEHLKLAGLEKTSSAEDIAALKGASDCVVTVLAAVQIMLNEPQAMPPEEVRKTIGTRLLELASIFEAGGYPAKVEPVAVDDTSTELAASAVAFLNTGLTQFGELRPVKSLKKPEEPSGFFLPAAFSDPVHVQFALKTTAAAMFCYLLYSILSWPGIHTALITCFIVSLGTAAESVEKLTLRIAGCLAGAGIGLVVMLRVIPRATGIGDLAMIVFAGALLGAWIAAGDKHISYAGFQIAFAYFLCVIQGPAPSFNMVVARDRVIGILLGNVVAYFMATQVWPVSVGPRIDSTLQKVREKLESIAGGIDGWYKRRVTAEAHSMLDEIASDIKLAAYEPASIRPGDAWLEARQRAVEEAQKLESPLLAQAELAPGQARVRFREASDAADQSEDYVVQANSPKDSPLASLEKLLHIRIASFQQAMSKLNQAEEHGKI